MSLPKYVDGKAKSRDRSADGDFFIRVPTHPVPAAREIPLPEFYPTERTSTASFKAPVTAAGRKKMETAKPPPPGTLTTAIGYISSPVKYISSIFSGSITQPPEPPKPKERLFKIDLEKEKEKQASPKLTASLTPKRLTPAAVLIEEASPPFKAQQKVRKSQSSAWRRRNMMDHGSSRPASPNQASNIRGQKRITPSNSPTQELTSPSFNKLMISSSMNQNSYKVISKLPTAEDSEKKIKKDNRKGSNVSTQKESLVRTNVNKSNLKNIPPTPSKLNVPTTKEDYPVIPFPTVLPPRVPPPTYTIRSKKAPVTETQEEEVREIETAGENDMEDNKSGVLSSTREKAELVSYPSPTILSSERPSSVDDENAFELQETLGRVNINETARVSRLDQLPHGRLSNATSIKNLFNDVKLIHGAQSEATLGDILPAGRIRGMNVILCSSSIKYTSPTRTSQSPSKPYVIRRSQNVPPSPTRKPGSPTLMRAQKGHAKPSPVPTLLNQETGLKTQEKSNPNQGVQIRSNQSNEVKTNKEIIPKKFKSNSPKQATRDPQRKPSPLRVEDKHLSEVEESIGRPLNQKMSRPSSWNKSPVTEVQVQRANSGHGIHVKPKIKRVPQPKSRNPSPARLQQPSANKQASNTSPASPTAAQAERAAATVAASPTAAQSERATATVAASPTAAQTAKAAATVAASAAVAALSNFLKPTNEKETKDIVSDPPAEAEQPEKEEKKHRSRSPFAKMYRDKTAPALGMGSPAQKADEQLGPLEVPDSATDRNAKPKRSLSGEARGFLKKKFHDVISEKNPQLSADNFIEIKNNPKKKVVKVEDNEELSCLDNYCGDPSKYFRAATMMGEIP